jgi:hypothetical protein
LNHVGRDYRTTFLEGLLLMVLTAIATAIAARP